MILKSVLSFSLLIVFNLTLENAFALEATKTKPVVLKWMVAHAPNNYFVEMAKYFKKRVESETNKSVLIEIVDDFENEKKTQRETQFTANSNFVLKRKITYKKDVLENTIPNVSLEDWQSILQNTTTGEVFFQRVEAYKLMIENKIDMAQAYTHFLARVADTDYHALELPYVFDNYEHIEKFFASNVAHNLLNKSVDKTGVRGLAFTFSGGLLQTLSHEKDNLTLDHVWKNKKFRSTGSLVRDNYMKILGAELITVTDSSQLRIGGNGFSIKKGKSLIRPTQLINTNVVDVEEITLPDIELQLAKTLEKATRLKGIKKIKKLSVSETSHTLLSTVFMINEKSFQKLNKAQQEVIQKVAIDAAKLERELTINRYNKAKKYLLDNNFTWYSMIDKDRATHRLNAKKVYEDLYIKFPSTKDIVKGIENSRVEPKKIAGN